MKTQKTNGIKLSLAYTFFTLFMLIVFCLILITSAKAQWRFQELDKALEKYIICQQCSAQIQENANYLTEQARLFVVTQKKEYLAAYLKEYSETRRQEHALTALEAVCSKKDVALQRLRIAIEQGQSLANMELYAMRLIFEATGMDDMPPTLAALQVSPVDKAKSCEKLHETAINNLFGDGYLIYKMRINENCNLTVSAIEQQIKEELNLDVDDVGKHIHRLSVLIPILLIANALLFVTFALLVILPLKKFSIAIKNDEKLKIIGSHEFMNLAKAYNEIYEIKAQNEQSLLQEAEYDALTGILNRRAFDQLCAKSHQKAQPIALLLIDMDNFKQINDRYGHAGGDTALKTLAEILKKTFREDDYVARIGGDEFAVILPDFTSTHTTAIARKINNVNGALKKIKGFENISVSVGVAVSPTGYTEDLYKQADAALYRVKERGKHGCEIFTEKLQQNR